MIDKPDVLILMTLLLATIWFSTDTGTIVLEPVPFMVDNRVDESTDFEVPDPRERVRSRDARGRAVHSSGLRPVRGAVHVVPRRPH